MICFLRDTTSYDFTELKWKLDWYVRSVCMPTYDRFHTLLQSLVVFNIFYLIAVQVQFVWSTRAQDYTHTRMLLMVVA